MDKKSMLDQLKRHLGISKNKDFAELLGIKPSTLSMWYKRNTLDYDLLFTKFEFINPAWLLTGEGSMLKSVEHLPVSEDCSKIKAVLTEKETKINHLTSEVDILNYTLQLSRKYVDKLEQEIKTLKLENEKKQDTSQTITKTPRNT